MNRLINRALEEFSPISLEELNEKAEMMARIDNKYILKSERLLPALIILSEYFDVLEIDGRNAFEYASRYFDDAERHGYYDHHQRRRKRCKVRVREYVDSKLYFLEVKVNEQRSMTTKRRVQIDKPISSLDMASMNFVETCYRDTYDDEFVKELETVINIKYQRITLVAKEGGERLTLDTNINFSTSAVDCNTPKDTFIIETKSARGNGIADKILRSMHVKPTKRVSKYCLGMVATGQVLQHNGFLPALKRLELLSPTTHQ